MKILKGFIAAAIILTQVMWSINGYANPSGGTVVVGTGSATFDSSVPNTLTVNQTSAKVVIEWPTFSIAKGETTQFVQPSSSSVALNRVTGGSPSDIYGTLSSNGMVFLINQNGILFAPGSQVNVGGLIASSLDITNNEFAMANYQSLVHNNPTANPGYYFIGANGFGSVVNNGTININAPGGFAALLGSSVENTGSIMTKVGSVALASGNAIAVNLDVNGSISAVVVPAGLDNNLWSTPQH